jgi:hypothetical protein
MPEHMITGNRAIQVWMCGETLCALHAYVDATGGFVSVHAGSEPGVRPYPLAQTLEQSSADLRWFGLTGRHLAEGTAGSLRRTEGRSVAAGLYVLPNHGTGVSGSRNGRALLLLP